MLHSFDKVKLHYGFLDESGILEKKAKTGNLFIITAVIVAHPSLISQVMKMARRRAQPRFKRHKVFKASKEDAGFIKLVLQELSKKDIKIAIGVWNKKRIKQPFTDKNALYIRLLAQTICLVMDLYPNLSLVVHKRYANPIIRNQLSRQVREIVFGSNRKGFLILDQKTEMECLELEMADAVAWAVFQKYNNKKLEFYNLIKKRIIKENRLAA